MYNLKEYIIEKLKINNDIKSYKPKELLKEILVLYGEKIDDLDKYIEDSVLAESILDWINDNKVSNLICYIESKYDYKDLKDKVKLIDIIIDEDEVGKAVDDVNNHSDSYLLAQSPSTQLYGCDKYLMIYDTPILLFKII